MAQHVGWRNFFWLNVAILGLVFILLIFFFPETKWHRAHPSEIHNSSSPAGQQPVAQRTGGVQTPASNASDGEKPTEMSQEDAALEQADSSEIDPWLHKGYPSKKQFMLWSIDSNKSHLKTVAVSFFTPWVLLFFPIIELAAFIVSWSASVFLTLNLTQSQAFAAPPYNLSPQTIGFFNFAILVGAVIGLATNGPLSDWVSMVATKRNRGIREPEMRLPAMIPYLLISILGNFVVAFGYQYKWSWKVNQMLKQNAEIASPNSLLCSSSNVCDSLQNTGHCHHRIYLRWHSSDSTACNCIHVRH